MRWIAFALLAYVATGLQMGLSPYIAYHGASPNLVLLAAVFVAVNSPRDAALLGCFLLGLCQDLGSMQTLGVSAFSFGLMAIIVVNTQNAVYKDHPLTHFTMALVGGLITAAVMVTQGWMHPPIRQSLDSTNTGKPFHISGTIALTSVVYTAVLAPIVLWLLSRLKPLFGFTAARRKGRAWM